MRNLDPFVDIAIALRAIEEAFGFAEGTMEVTIPRDDFIRFKAHQVFGQCLKYTDPKVGYGDAPAMVCGRLYRPRPNAEQTPDKPSDHLKSDGRKTVGK